MPLSIKTFFDADTFSFTHLIYDPSTHEAAVIDPVLNYDPAAIKFSTSAIEQVYAEITNRQLDLKWILETHVHADHMSAAQWLKQKTQAEIVIGAGVAQVQQTFNQVFQFSAQDAATAEDFDLLVKQGDQLPLGQYQITVLATPGHTPACCTYVVDNRAFVGDTLFMPDFGSARCDFPGGDAAQLYHSIQKILTLPDNTQLMMCHDYMPGGRELKWQCSVLEQKQSNIHINQNVTQTDYIKMRRERDQQLSMPKLIYPALQINIRAGKLPSAEANGGRFLKLPIS